MSEASARRGVWHAIGPGIVFAGAAVGVSHLVQSTRAGARYGLALLAFVILANLVKYPAFRFGPQYAAATGTSMLEGYRRRGRGALWLYAGLTLATMFTVQAAVTFVTAGLAQHLFGFSFGPLWSSAGLLATCCTLLAVGHYGWLDRITKVAVAIFSVATLVATAMALGVVDWSGPLLPDFGSFAATDYLFVAALIGWMPSAIDVSVWQSLWTLARARDAGRAPSVRESMLDFHIGYFGTVVLALCFLVLGAAVLHRPGIEIPPQPAAFAGMLIDVYAQTLGAWSRPVIGLSAFLVMFSTTLTVTDGFPRALSVLAQRLRAEENPDEEPGDRRIYGAAMVVIALGSMTILTLAVQSLKTLVDVATTTSFLTAPMLAALNHRAMHGAEVPIEGRPLPWLRIASLVGISIQLAFALSYLCLKVSGLGS